jgi:hypothetical protein
MSFLFKNKELINSIEFITFECDKNIFSEKIDVNNILLLSIDIVIKNLDIDLNKNEKEEFLMINLYIENNISKITTYILNYDEILNVSNEEKNKLLQNKYTYTYPTIIFFGEMKKLCLLHYQNIIYKNVYMKCIIEDDINCDGVLILE